MTKPERKEYQRRYSKAWREKNAEKLKADKSAYYQKNKKSISKKHRAYARKNREKIADDHARYYRRHKNRLAEKMREHYRQNKTQYIRRATAWASKHPRKRSAAKQKWDKTNGKTYWQTYRILNFAHKRDDVDKAYRAANAVRCRALMLAQKSKRRALEAKAKCGDLKAVREFYATLWAAEKARCHWCKKELPKGQRTVDHKKPLAKGGRHSVGNLVPACRSCNFSKGTKSVREWKKHLALKAKLVVGTTLGQSAASAPAPRPSSPNPSAAS